ncbi:hypothetical protein Pfo_013621 [Paulownia fortunei]|nr:hypothetical protein Pfo_013621 [Paulownia fortunei]
MKNITFTKHKKSLNNDLSIYRRENEEVDYFSFLPDALILIIITFLPFKEAVRTSVLSRRWRNLWQSTRNIDLDEKFFVKNESSGENRAMQRRNFLGFIRRWMENYTEPDVEKYRLVISNPPKFYLPEVQECIRFAVDHREVKALDLDFSDPAWDAENLDIIPQTSLRLPLILDAHTMLESLGLSACNFRVPLFSRFFALKNVFLGWMEMPSSSLNNFLSMCPSLEILILKRCWNVGNLDIDAQRLRVLVLDKCSGPEFISVNAPLLNFFKYCGLSVYLQMENHRRMVEAVFDFSLQPEWDDEGDPEMLYNLLSEIWSVRALTICSYMLQVLPMAESSLLLKPSLTSVTQLFLKTQLHIQEYYGITFFLNSCPRLEVLSIDLGPTRIFQDYRPPYRFEEHPFWSHLWYPGCVESTLKTVKVIGFKGSANELVVLSYILKFGKVLEYLFISLSEERGANGMDMEPMYHENFQRLLQCDISSSHLQVYLSTG